jgi:tRNA threonylcarbamoyladenosine biosynthesis protein TsaB
MLVLAIDTALSACSAALWREGEAVAARVEPMAKGQAERLAPLVQELLAEAGVVAAALDRIAVTTGPGAFTGVRIGLSFVRAFALALGRPAVGVSTLEVLAAGACVERVVPVIAVAGSVFAAAYAGRRVVAAPQRVLDPQAFLARLDADGWSLTGPGAASLAELRPDWPVIDLDLPDPLVLAGLAAFRDPAEHPATPLYLRGADAKLPGGRTVPDLTGLADFVP